MMCFVSGIICPALSAPSNGAVSTGIQQAPHGTVASFTCRRGYLLDGYNKRTCTGSGPRGRWTGTQPSCKGIVNSICVTAHCISVTLTNFIISLSRSHR